MVKLVYIIVVRVGYFLIGLVRTSDWFWMCWRFDTQNTPYFSDLFWTFCSPKLSRCELDFIFLIGYLPDTEILIYYYHRTMRKDQN